MHNISVDVLNDDVRILRYFYMPVCLRLLLSYLSKMTYYTQTA